MTIQEIEMIRMGAEKIQPLPQFDQLEKSCKLIVQGY